MNTDFGTPIVITALNDGINPLTGDDLTQVAGELFTYVDSTSGSPVSSVSFMTRASALGAGFFVFDTVRESHHVSKSRPPLSRTLACFPRPPPTNFHFHKQHARAIQPMRSSGRESTRTYCVAQLGLCLRNVCSHDGGCGAGNDCGGSTGTLKLFMFHCFRRDGFIFNRSRSTVSDNYVTASWPHQG